MLTLNSAQSENAHISLASVPLFLNRLIQISSRAERTQNIQVIFSQALSIYHMPKNANIHFM
jgi:hypothetical protein